VQVLDGKNHHRGTYEKVVLGRVVGLLNTGKNWGWLDHPLTAKNYAPEAILRADAAFLATLRSLVNQWIASGINEDGTETPSGRYVRGLPKGYSESLFDVLRGWLGRNMPRPALTSDGRIKILAQSPSPDGLEAEAYAREGAIYHFKELLESPAPHRLGRCKNCGAYFARKRERKGYIKRGTYCGNCKLSGSAERTKASRQSRKNQRLDAAAKAWPQWRRSHKHPNQAEWVAQQVNKQVHSGPVQRKWVSQNIEEILERVAQGQAV
jgi:predicted  nucleic acid-binding Zn-ribbon protein